MHTQPLLSRRLPMAAAAMACVMSACGGDQVAGIEGSGAPVASSAVTTVGTITGFGSIIVDGVEYATSGAQIHIDDEPAAESQLRVGQVVTIKGKLNADGTTGTADDVSFSSNARGSVAQVDALAGTFDVLGQTVQVNNDTVFDESFQAPDVAGLPVGARVQVSGFADAAGNLVASRIDAAAPNIDLQVRGTLQALDTIAHTFRVNALTVDYSAATLSGTLQTGGDVTVKGATLAANGVLLANRVTVAASTGSAGAANEQGQIEGLIATFTSGSDFVVNAQRVTTNTSTQFVLHDTALGLNVPVKIRGTFNAAGVLVASKVEVEQRPAGVVRGVVDSVSSTSGTLTVIGVTATTSGVTTFEDRSKDHVRAFRLADVRAGDYVEVRGTGPAGGPLSATLVERDKPESRSYVEGIALNVAAPNLTVLGVTVMTNAQTHFQGLGGGAKGAAEFFSQALNMPVKVRGTLSGNTLIADQVQITK
jgi:hypothetical protein